MSARKTRASRAKPPITRAPGRDHRDALFTHLGTWLRAEDIVLFHRVVAPDEKTVVGLSHLAPAGRLEECGLVTVKKKRGWVNQPRFGGEAWEVAMTARGRDFARWRAEEAAGAEDREAYVRAQLGRCRAAAWERAEVEAVMGAVWEGVREANGQIHAGTRQANGSVRRVPAEQLNRISKTTKSTGEE